MALVNVQKMYFTSSSFTIRPTVWTIVGQGPIALAICAGGGCLDIFTLLYRFSPLSPSPWYFSLYRAVS